MKINNHKDSVDISQLARSKKNEKAAALQAKKQTEEAAESGAVDSTASVEISGEAKALANANQIAKSDNPDQAKIDRIKALIQAGNYKPDFGKVADKMLNETLLQDIS